MGRSGLGDGKCHRPVRYAIGYKSDSKFRCCAVHLSWLVAICFQQVNATISSDHLTVWQVKP
jgi:hypothetical protein